MTTDLSDKKKHLLKRLRSCESAVVALSGGVDSSVLLALAAQAVRHRLVAVTLCGPSQASGEKERALEIAQKLGVEIREEAAPEFKEESYLANEADRCYHCKLARYKTLAEFARTQGIACLLDGTNADDLGERRPGLAAAREQGVQFPLADAGLTKDEVRALARELELPNAEAPADACLATRLPFGKRIEVEHLERIGKAEARLRKLIAGRLRLRDHGPLARLEIDPHYFNLMADERLRGEISRIVHEAGYSYVALDLDGYRTGSADETLPDL